MLKVSINYFLLLITLFIPLAIAKLSYDNDYSDKQSSTFKTKLTDFTIDLSPVAIGVVIILSIACVIICLVCCILIQKRPQPVRRRRGVINNANATESHQQPVRVVMMRSNYQFSAVPRSQIYPSVHEAPPPPYEIAVANLHRPLESSLSPPIATISSEPRHQ